MSSTMVSYDGHTKPRCCASKEFGAVMSSAKPETAAEPPKIHCVYLVLTAVSAVSGDGKSAVLSLLDKIAKTPDSISRDTPAVKKSEPAFDRVRRT